MAAMLVAASSAAHAQVIPPAAIDPTADFFDDSVVHELKLWINSRDWETLKTNFLSNAYYPADFEWKGTTVRNVGIRSRGNGSRSGFKPGLRVDIDRYSTTQKFLGLKSFVLRNNTQDPSQLHEWLSMHVFRRMGLSASREAFARLFVNNQYVGLYTIVESVDNGANWSPVSPLTAVSVGPSVIKTATVFLPPRDLSPAGPRQWGIRVARLAGSAATLDISSWACQLQVRLENRVTTSAPFDAAED